MCVTIAADRVFDTHETTEEIHRELISPIIESVMKGIHGQYSTRRRCCYIVSVSCTAAVVLYVMPCLKALPVDY